jgi:hypothetical protein
MKRLRVANAVCFLAACAAWGRECLGGMPSPLPSEVPRFLRLTDSALGRLQTISFFLLTFLASALVVMLLWNYMRRDFAWMPRMSYGRAAAAVFLWGLLFVVVLTMISGARELMTPGAWEKQGFTYKLKDPPKASSGESSAGEAKSGEADGGGDAEAKPAESAEAPKS